MRHGAERAAWLLQVRRCDRAAKHPEGPHGDADRDSRTFAEYVEAELSQGLPLTVRDLALGGGQLAELGVSGPAIGALQRRLLDRAQRANDPREFNTPERLARAASKILANGVADPCDS